MANMVERISPKDAYPLVRSGKALLVCAYENPYKFASVRLEGAISLQEFRSLRSGLPKDKEVIFYCA